MLFLFRLIIEASSVGVPGCQVSRMRRSGVEIVVRRQTGLMHNKFILIDNNILITGSFNWTYQVLTTSVFVFDCCWCYSFSVYITKCFRILAFVCYFRLS